MPGEPHVVFKLAPHLDTPEAVDEAFQHFRRFNCKDVALVFPDESSPGVGLTDAVVRQLRKSPHVRSVALIHSRRALGLVASSVALVTKGVRVRAYTTVDELHDLDGGVAPLPRDPDQSVAGARLAELAASSSAASVGSVSTRLPTSDVPSSPPEVGRLNLVVARFDGGSADALRRSFRRFRDEGGVACVLLVDPDCDFPRELLPVFVEGIRSVPSIRALGIVHPSPLAGFLASSLRLQADGVLVRAFRSLAEATELPELLVGS